MKNIDLSGFAVTNAKIISEAFHKLYPDSKEVIGVMVSVVRSDGKHATHSYGYDNLSNFDRLRIVSDVLNKSIEELYQAGRE